MPNYGRYSDPADQYQGTAFNPYTGRLNGAQLVMQFLSRMEADKRKKKEAGWELEDRDLKKRYTEAQISNLYETRPTPEPKPISNVTATQVKSLMGKLGYPEEVITEVDSMNDIARRDTWGKLQDHLKSLQLQGAKIPRTAATPKGKQQAAALKSALDVVQRRLAPITGALTQLYSNPEHAMLSQERISWLEKEQEKINEQVGAIASMINNIDESGELTDQQFVQLNTILKYQRTYRPYPKREPPKKEPPKTEAEKKLPAGFTIQK